MVFAWHTCEKIKRFLVNFGGIQNDNDYAIIEIEYEEIYCDGTNNSKTDNIKKVYYIEYGKNYKKELIGDDVEWIENFDEFKVLKNGKYVNKFNEE